MEPIGGPVGSQPIGGACPKCGAVHDPAKCKGHKRIDDGWRQCRGNKLTDQDVCGAHGGKAPRSIAAAKQRGTERELRKTLGRLTSTPVTDPLTALQHLAGKAHAWMDLLEGHVAELERLRYSAAEGGEHIRGEVVLFERAMDQCRKVLVDVARLDIDERLMRITEGQMLLALQLVDAILRRSGLDPESPVVREAKAAEILAIAGEPTAGQAAA